MTSLVRPAIPSVRPIPPPPQRPASLPLPLPSQINRLDGQANSSMPMNEAVQFFEAKYPGLLGSPQALPTACRSTQQADSSFPLEQDLASSRASFQAGSQHLELPLPQSSKNELASAFDDRSQLG